jgi:fructosamine-3-kinase
VRFLYGWRDTEVEVGHEICERKLRIEFKICVRNKNVQLDDDSLLRLPIAQAIGFTGRKMRIPLFTLVTIFLPHSLTAFTNGVNNKRRLGRNSISQIRVDASFSSFLNYNHRRASPQTSCLSMSKTETSSFMDSISSAISDALAQTEEVEYVSGSRAASLGSGASTTIVKTSDDTKYFVKSATAKHMIYAEYVGVKEMAETNTIRVPRPIAYGEHDASTAFVVFEYLEFSDSCSNSSHYYELGRQLAKMHRTTSASAQFGFSIDNTCGATHQPNTWTDHWIDFWDTQRLGHMLQLLNNLDMSHEQVDRLRAKTRTLLSHNPPPSLLHGDLWGGNKGFVLDAHQNAIVPCIFDPATYYGDREADIAMTYLFGGFSPDFYRGYNEEWPLAPEFESKRKIVYNLYHVMNHAVLFGGGYKQQALSMCDQIFKL